MKCVNCSNELSAGARYCTVCGAAQTSGAQTASWNSSPALQLPTGRSLLKMIFLNLITLGIYSMVIYSRISSEINIVASRYDGKRTMPFLAVYLLALITLGIYPFVWHHQFSNRVGSELKRRGYSYTFGASDFWLWNVLGSLIFVGPFVYCHKLMESMNMVNKNYNIYG